MEIFVKRLLAHKYKLNKNDFIQEGGVSDKIFKIEYDKKIELEFKKINKNSEEIEIYISNNIDDRSCLTIQINKKLQIASIHAISKENNCFFNGDFLLKNPGSFYLEMSLKFLKKYKDKFNIKKITLIDNAQIYCEGNGKFNLSQFLLLTKGYTWYEKYGFKIIDKIRRNIVEESKKVIKNLKIFDIEFDSIFDDIKKYKEYKLIDTTLLLQIKQTLKDNKNQKFMSIMNFIFNENRTNNTCLLYSLMNGKLLSQLETKFKNFSKLEQLEYYMKV